MTVEITGERLLLRQLDESMVSQAYVNWLNDKEINRYLESRFQTHTLDSVRSFVINAQKSEHLFGIFHNATSHHIGNIKLGAIHPWHLHADIGFLIGEKNCWGKGYGSEALAMMLSYAFQEKRVHKVYGGVHAPNIGSARMFEKNGFTREAVRHKHCLMEGEWIDLYEYGLLAEDFKQSNSAP